MSRNGRSPVVKEKSNTAALWSEAQSYEHQLKLKVAEQTKRREPTSAVVDPEGDKLRVCLLELYEDVLTGDPPFATARAVDEKLWNLVFYSRIEELRSIIRKMQTVDQNILPQAVAELNRQLDLAVFFYQTLILTLKSRIGNNTWSFDPNITGVNDDQPNQIDLSRLYATFIYKSLVFLGDLSRYRDMYSENNSKRWQSSEAYYRKALRVNPDIGRAQAQMAIIATYRKENLDVIYWYYLSLANTAPQAVVRDNLSAFYAKFVDSMDTTNTAPTRASITSDFLAFQRDIYILDEVSIGDMVTAYKKFSANLQPVLTPTEEANLNAKWLIKTAVVLFCCHHDMNSRFTSTDDTATRKKIRIFQALALAMVFDMASVALNIVCQRTNESGQPVLSSWDETMQLDSAFSLLAPISLICMWMEVNLDVILQFQTYAKTMNEAQMLQSCLLNFARSIARGVNLVSGFADMDGSDDCLPEDEELISLPSLRPYYRSLDRESVKNCLCGKHLPPAEQMSARVSRIARFGKRLSDDERFDFFRFNEQEAQFVVLDDEAKKKGMQKLMRVLAAERLKDQVSALEQSVSVLKEASRPIAVLDAYCYVHNLRLVKGWLTSRSCIIVVSSEAIDALDRMKKGDESINVRAREAIRYLEQRFRYRSDCLIAQKTEERVIGWSSDGYVGENHDVFVPKPYRPVLACSLHYQTHVAPSAIDGTDVPFALVTDDAELRGVAQAAGVVVRSVGEWAKLLEGRGRKRRR